ncbi:MAG: iron complex outermembrane receptor protein [Enterobacterales bacterium]|jgi:iron complex outermembrane receptor protein
MKLNTQKLLLPMAISMVLYGTVTVAEEDDEKNSDDDNRVTVTAQKRVERLEEVPIAMTVFPAEEIDQTGIQELRELAGMIPNLTISQGTDFGAKILIRGVGSNTRNIAFDSRVGVYLDGVYLGQGPALNQDLVDLEQVEVLRGPQGTLFGKNTVAGAINLISQKPHDELEGKVTVNLSNFSGKEIKASANIPLSDTVFAKVAISSRERDGYINNVYDESLIPTAINIVHPLYGPLTLPLCNTLGGSTPAGCAAGPVGPDNAPDTSKKPNNQDTTSYRAQLRYQPSDELEINIAMDGLDSKRIPILAIPKTEAFGEGLDYDAPGRYDVAYSENGNEEREMFGANLTIDYDFGDGYSMRSITALRDSKIDYLSDTDGSAIDFLTVHFIDEYRQETQEFQFISPDGEDFEYVLGAYLYLQDATTIRDANAGNASFFFGIPGAAACQGYNLFVDDANGVPHCGGAFNSGSVETTSKAIFMSGSYQIDEHWKLGFGARYSIETKDMDWHLDGTTSGAFAIGSTGANGLQDSRTDRKLSPTVSINYAMSDDVQVYAKYSTGFKSGGYNLDFITQADLDAGIEFDLEKSTSYEVGYKGNLLENTLSLNIALFSITYDDYQVNQFFNLGFDEDTGTQLTAIRITNAAAVNTDGAEVEMKWRVSDDFTIIGSMGFLNAEFDDFPGGLTELSDPSNPQSPTVSINAAGQKLPFASDFNANIAFQYYTQLESLGADLLMRLDIAHVGDYFTQIENQKTLDISGQHGVIYSLDLPHFGAAASIDYGYIEANTLLHGRIGLISDGAWELYLWGRNLTDEDAYTNDTRGFFGSRQFVPQTPRTYGIEVIYNF